MFRAGYGLHGIKWLDEQKSYFMLNPTRVSHQSWFARRQMKDTRVDERRLWALKTKGILDDSNMLGRANVSDETTSVERVLLGHRLLRIFVESLAVVCVLAAMLVGCASPTAIGARDTIGPRSSSAEPSAASGPRFAQGGPDAEEYGANAGYPVGDRTTCPQPAFRVGCHSHFDQVYEGRLVRRATTPSPLARTASEPPIRYEYEGQTFTLNDYLARNPATGLLVARGDTILVERYQYARHDRHRFTSWSMAKTVTAMLVGIAIAEGRIRSVDDLAAAYVPALAETEYGRTSLRHLLQMSSGVRFVEEYTGTDDVSRLAANTFRQVGSAGVEAVTPFNVRIAPAGTRFYYASVETQVLGLVLRNAVGRPVADYLQEKIWKPMGAEADATWLIDRAGQESAYCCINAVLRDYARLGLLLAHYGHWRGRQVIPSAWIEDATTVFPGQPQPRGGGYGYQVWILAGERRMFALRGVRGQAIYVDPASRLVMVHTAVRKQARDPGVRETNALWRSVVQQLGH
jgi:CubicO group peptidase (beta-lactamase class C family)